MRMALRRAGMRNTSCMGGSGNRSSHTHSGGMHKHMRLLIMLRSSCAHVCWKNRTFDPLNILATQIWKEIWMWYQVAKELDVIQIQSNLHLACRLKMPDILNLS